MMSWNSEAGKADSEASRFETGLSISRVDIGTVLAGHVLHSTFLASVIVYVSNLASLTIQLQLKRSSMEIHVYDTYVKANDGHTMHFDVFTAVKDDQKAVEYAKEWLTSIGEGDATITSKECRFCHSESAPANVAEAINKDGYFIYKMQGCK
jgi:hypothetical protein